MYITVNIERRPSWVGNDVFLLCFKLICGTISHQFIELENDRQLMAGEQKGRDVCFLLDVEGRVHYS